MSVFDYDKNQDNQKPFHAAGMAENAAKRATEDNQDKYAKQDNTPSGGNEEHFSLNDDRRVKVLSPGALVAKRFFRNRLAVVGLSILIFMFVFSFIGGLLSPYGEDEFFYREDQINKEFAVVTENSDFRYMAKDSNLFGSAVQAQTMLAIQKNSESFSYNGTNYALAQEGSDFYSISSGGKLIGIAYKDVVSSSDGQALSFEFVYTALKSYAALAQEVEEEAEQETAGVSEATGATDDAAEPAEPEEVSEPAAKTFTVDGLTYTIDEDGGVLQGEKEVAYISRYIVQPIMPDIFLSRDFKEKLIDTIAVGGTKFTYTDESLILNDEPDAALDGEETGIGAMDDALVEEDDTVSDATMEYTIERSQNHANWIIRQQQSSRQYDSYSFPSAKHWLGTDKYGMDMLTRLMYGGRVSLMIGFIVIIIETVLGVILGGIAGYFGGFLDMAIMRVAEVVSSMPFIPFAMILSAVLGSRVSVEQRMYIIMVILGLLSWPGLCRQGRAQMFAQREMEYVTAAKTIGVKENKIIFKHIIPNVMSVVLVSITLSFGTSMLTESTLSYLGFGIPAPTPTWGNMLSNANNSVIIQNYWWNWVFVGLIFGLSCVCINLIGDGLRDALDPKSNER